MNQTVGFILSAGFSVPWGVKARAFYKFLCQDCTHILKEYFGCRHKSGLVLIRPEVSPFNSCTEHVFYWINSWGEVFVPPSLVIAVYISRVFLIWSLSFAGVLEHCSPSFLRFVSFLFISPTAVWLTFD